MYKRFVIEAMQQDARDAFKNAAWIDGDDRVQGWYDLIKQCVEDMEIPPDEYAIREKFMGGLPYAFRTHIFTDKLSIEYNTLDELADAALDAECALCSEK